MNSPLDRVRVVLCATSHPGNIGAAARAMHAMGLSRLVLVAPRRFPHPEADALAAGASALLRAATVVPTLDAALAGATLAIGFSARPREFAGAASLPVRAAARSASRMRAPRRGGAGVRHRDVGPVERRARALPDRGDDSRRGRAGVAQSRRGGAGRRLRAARRRAAATPCGRRRASKPATHDEIEALYSCAQRTLVAMRFLDPRQPRRLLPRLRRLFARARLEKEEVNILRGILARIDQVLARRA